MRAQAIHVTIARLWTDVYAFASRPETMPLWASGLASGLVPDGGDWIASGPLGAARISFAPPNAFGVIDHRVCLPDGSEVYNALRVTPNGDGAEVVFVLLQAPEADDAAFARDAAWVLDDLMRLKALLETGKAGD